MSDYGAGWADGHVWKEPAFCDRHTKDGEVVACPGFYGIAARAMTMPNGDYWADGHLFIGADPGRAFTPDLSGWTGHE